MPPLDPDSAEAKRITEAMGVWRQGDVVQEPTTFVHVADPAQPLTDVCAEATGEVTAIVAEVGGLVVLTQTCDLVRHCTTRPYLEVAPLVEVPADVFEETQRRRRPGYAYVPALAERRLVADLDRVMTVEKSVAVSWRRTQGCRSDDEVRAFAEALARKRQRFAFPDDFTAATKALQSRMRSKHEKQTSEGQALRALPEIRVQASPGWNAKKVRLHFWFIRGEGVTTFAGKGWGAFREGWLALVPPSGRFVEVDGVVTTLADMTAKDYLSSDRLDLDNLSQQASATKTKDEERG